MSSGPLGMHTLRRVRDACARWDGFVPHGSAEWRTVRILYGAGLVDRLDDGVCETCPQPHDAPLFTLTDAGRRALDAVYGQERGDE